MSTKIILAVDVGSSGGIAYTVPGHGVCAIAMSKHATEGDLANMLRVVCSGSDVVAYIEKVSGFVRPRPGQEHENRQPGHAMFTFGEKAGLVRGILLALGAEIEMVAPREWQKMLFIDPKGEMTTTVWNKLKMIAQRRFPGINVTLATSDALLILAYGLIHSPNRIDGKTPRMAQDALEAKMVAADKKTSGKGHATRRPTAIKD